MKRYGLVIILATQLSGCLTTHQDGPPLLGRPIFLVPNTQVTLEPLSRIGNPSSYEVFGKRYYPMKSAKGYQEYGIASWYGTKFHGRATSNGEIFDIYQFTAAHKTLPLPSFVRVTNLNNQKQLIVRVNDRGPFHDDRLIDLSYAAAKKLDIYDQGTAPVFIEAIDPKAFLAAQNTTRYFIQVGAFSTQTQAEQFEKHMRHHGQTRIQLQASRYRVQLGPFTQLKQAEQKATQLRQRGYQNSIIKQS